MQAVLTDSVFSQIAEFIYQKTGIFIPPTKKYLVENRLMKLLEDYNLKGYEEFLYLVKYSPNGRELQRLYDAITTNETYFFREPQQFDVFLDYVIPRVLEKKPSRDLRVWCAACSSGEEPYTLGILMREKKPGLRTDIVASDISSNVLEAAKRGLYSSYSIRNVPEPYLNRYFKRQGQEYAIDSMIKSSVRFKNLNLFSEREMAEKNSFDVVFCRNVLIYFDEKAKKKTVGLLYDSLRPSGFLVIGSSESLHSVTRAFRPVTFNKVVVYEKV